MTQPKGFAPLTIVLIFAAALGVGLLAYLLVKVDVPPVVPMVPAPAATVPSAVASATEVGEFGGGSAPYTDPTVDINPAIAKDFDVSAVQNLQDMAKAYGVKFSPDDLKTLADRKFVVKSLLDTSIRPSSGGDNVIGMIGVDGALGWRTNSKEDQSISICWLPPGCGRCRR